MGGAGAGRHAAGVRGCAAGGGGYRPRDAADGARAAGRRWVPGESFLLGREAQPASQLGGGGISGRGWGAQLPTLPACLPLVAPGTRGLETCPCCLHRPSSPLRRPWPAPLPTRRAPPAAPADPCCCCRLCLGPLPACCRGLPAGLPRGRVDGPGGAAPRPGQAAGPCPARVGAPVGHLRGELPARLPLPPRRQAQPAVLGQPRPAAAGLRQCHRSVQVCAQPLPAAAAAGGRQASKPSKHPAAAAVLPAGRLPACLPAPVAAAAVRPTAAGRAGPAALVPPWRGGGVQAGMCSPPPLLPAAPR